MMEKQQRPLLEIIKHVAQNSILKYFFPRSFRAHKSRNQRKEPPRFSLDGSLVMNALLSLIFSLALCTIPQTKSLVDDGFIVDNVNPWITTLLVCLFSFTMFSFSRRVAIVKYERIFPGGLSSDQIPRITGAQYLFCLFPVLIFTVYLIVKSVQYGHIFIVCYLIVLGYSLLLWSWVRIERMGSLDEVKENHRTRNWIIVWVAMALFLRLNTYIIGGTGLSHVISLVVLILFALIPFYLSLSGWLKSDVQSHGTNFKLPLFDKKINIGTLVNAIIFGGFISFFVYTWFNMPLDDLSSIVFLDVLLLFLIAVKAATSTYFLSWLVVLKLRLLKVFVIVKKGANDDDSEIHDSISEYRESVWYLLLFIAISFVVYANFIRPFSGYAEKYLEIEKTEKVVDSQVPFSEYAAKWLDSCEHGEDSLKPIYLVAGQGGGSRAAYWMAAGLHHLDTIYEQILVTSTVSGSSVGASCYRLAKEYQRTNQTDSMSDRIDYFFEKNFVTSTALRLFFYNPLQKLFPRILAKFKGRNYQLMKEESLAFAEAFMTSDDNFRKIQKNGKYSNRYKETPYWQDFQSAHVKSLSEKMPVLVLNSYNVSKKRKSIISPVSIQEETAEDLIQILNAQDKGLTLAQAVNLSQMFPIISASAHFQGNNYYDGGVYDNSGLSTLRTMYNTLNQIRDHHGIKRRIVVLYFTTSQFQESKASRSGVNALFNAATGSIFSASMQRHFVKLKNELEEYGDTLCEISFKTGKDTKVNLNRWLSSKQVEQMRSNSEYECNLVLDLVRKDSFARRQKSPQNHEFELFFALGEDTLRNSEKKKLYEHFAGLVPIDIEVWGYTDTVGSTPTQEVVSRRAMNDDLSKRRVKNSIDLLVKMPHITKELIQSQEPRYLGERGCNEGNSLDGQLCRKVVIKYKFYKSNSRYFAPRLN